MVRASNTVSGGAAISISATMELPAQFDLHGLCHCLRPFSFDSTCFFRLSRFRVQKRRYWSSQRSRLAQRFGIEPVDAVAAFADFGDELGVVQNAKVFGDGGAADVEAAGDLVDGLSAVAQAVENGAAGGVGDGVKNAAFLRNHLVTCFANHLSGWCICNRMVTSVRPKDTRVKRKIVAGASYHRGK